jgi:hypothetical protein
MDRTSRQPEALASAATTTVDCANALFQGRGANLRSQRLSHQTEEPSSPTSCGPPYATSFTSSTPRQQHTTRIPTGWCNASTAAPMTPSGPAAPWRTGRTTYPGSCWATAWRQERRTTPPLLRQCSAHHSFYLANILIPLNFRQALPSYGCNKFLSNPSSPVLPLFSRPPSPIPPSRSRLIITLPQEPVK